MAQSTTEPPPRAQLLQYLHLQPDDDTYDALIAPDYGPGVNPRSSERQQELESLFDVLLTVKLAEQYLDMWDSDTESEDSEDVFDCAIRYVSERVKEEKELQKA